MKNTCPEELLLIAMLTPTWRDPTGFTITNAASCLDTSFTRSVTLWFAVVLVKLRCTSCPGTVVVFVVPDMISCGVWTGLVVGDVVVCFFVDGFAGTLSDPFFF